MEQLYFQVHKALILNQTFSGRNSEAIKEFEKILQKSNVHLGALLGLLEAHKACDIRGRHYAAQFYNFNKNMLLGIIMLLLKEETALATINPYIILDVNSLEYYEAKIESLKTKAKNEEMYSAAAFYLFNEDPKTSIEIIENLIQNSFLLSKVYLLKGWSLLALNKDISTAHQCFQQSNQLSECDYQNPQSAMGLAECAKLERKYDEAISIYDSILEIMPTFFPAHIEKAELYFIKKEWKNCFKEVKMGKNVASDDITMEQMEILLLIVYEGYYNEAANLFSELLEHDKITACEGKISWIQWTLIYCRICGRNGAILKKAKSYLELELKKHPKNFTAMVAIGEVLRMSGLYESALDVFQKASKMDDETLCCFKEIAHCQISQGMLGEAKEQINFISAIDDQWNASYEGELFKAFMSVASKPDPKTIRLTIEAMNTTSMEFGVEFLQKLNADFIMEILKITCDLLSAESDLVRSKEIENICKSSISILSQLLRYIPGLQTAYFISARLHILENNFPQAILELQQLLKMEDFNVNVGLLLADAYIQNKNLTEATDVINASLSCDFTVRNLPEYYMVKVKQAHMSENFEEAIQMLKNALHTFTSKKDGKNKKTDFFFTMECREVLEMKMQLNLILLYISAKRVEEAQKVFLQVKLKRNAGFEASLLFIEAQLRLAKNDVEGCVYLLKNVLPDSWYYFEARKCLADVYLNYKQDLKNYIACHKEMIQSVESSEAYVLCGEAYMNICMPEKAIEMYEQAMKMKAKNINLTKMIGEAYVKSHNYLKAANYLEVSLKNSNDDSIRYQLAHLLLKLKNYDKCEIIINQYIEKCSFQNADVTNEMRNALNITKVKELATFYELLSDLYNETNRLNESIEVLETAKALMMNVIKAEPVALIGSEDFSNYVANLSLKIGKQHQRHRNYHKAIFHYTEGLSTAPKSIPIMLALAHVYLTTGQWEECEQQCQRVLRLDKENTEALLVRKMNVDILYQKNEKQLALENFECLLKQNPNNYHALLRIIDLSFRIGNLQYADNFIDLAMKNNPRTKHDPGFNYCKGYYEWNRGNPDGALQCFNRTRNDPEWGEVATYNIVEICLNPDNQIIGNEYFEKDQSEDADSINECSNVKALRISTATRLLKELRFNRNDECRYRLLENFILLASKSKADVEKALTNFLRLATASENKATNIGSIFGIAQAHKLLKQHAKAKIYLKETLSVPWNLDDAKYLEQCWLLLANTYMNQGKMDAASEILKTCMQHNASCIKALEYLSLINEKQQKWADAVSNLEMAWTICKHRHPAIGYRLAYIYLKAKRYVDAVDTCHVVLNNFPDYPRIKHDILDKARLSFRT
ncbi:Tetratricopeptide repeat protein 21B [Trichinella zimbabwensis]|uniref:Tetratricopeptide repeat protein 21B n=1 Tax=Trichinella zimbabwensis TaxID=268475 RepID=A0A0V1I8N3_9BILA|nr:Tetratricopeptide repeat protein 21B [Trichinella zimbabwensis]